MKEILELIITNLVDNKEEVSIEETVADNNIDYKVKVSKDGRVTFIVQPRGFSIWVKENEL